ncbi:E3 ubiquitin-protein ligase TRIM21 [Liparis tanakae]|uniref:E3 ubiquitin-protein ligase TRIM21 n=1 Tax=Liparis tanakae TaxID=230148 RepID=A0A4Z2GIN3_9TELE|nr:E3 ubiquitin-protein ligase TRIM21 [Liparis tanakae]
MAFALSEEQFRCVICLDIFHNPVSTPCGHNFCLTCIKRFWDTRHKSECPLCKEAFKTRPELRINVGLKDITEKFKESIRGRPAYKKTLRRGMPPREISKEDVPCDSCTVNPLMSVKSCFVCQLSYCNEHLKPHLNDPVLTKHSLTDPATFATSHLCRIHNKPLNKFCKRDQTPICIKCRELEHKHHETVSIEKESKKLRIQIKKIEGEFQGKVQIRLGKLKEINASSESSKINKEQEIEKSIQVVTRVVSVIERNQAALIAEIERKQEAADITEARLRQELGQEIGELQRRLSELQLLEHTDDNLHLLQVRKVLEMSTVYQYAVDVTLDPVTASGWLSLSADGKQVSLSQQQKKPSPPDDQRRFDACVSVLGKQCFTSGKHYWVVQVSDKTDWDLGVARESINRKGTITVRPDNGYWAICRRQGGSLSACAGPSVTLRLQETPHKVGVFLDYEEGSVSFYDAEAKTHIYTFGGCDFNEPMYPYLNPCLHDNGKNTAPLIICPVEVGENGTGV